MECVYVICARLGCRRSLWSAAEWQERSLSLATQQLQLCATGKQAHTSTVSQGHSVQRLVPEASGKLARQPPLPGIVCEFPVPCTHGHFLSSTATCISLTPMIA